MTTQPEGDTMEGSGAFAQEIGPGKDPFEGSDFGDFDTGPPAATEELPTVDKEGQRIDQPPAEAPAEQAAPAQAPQDGASAESQQAPAAPAPPQGAQAAPAPAVAEEAVQDRSLAEAAAEVQAAAADPSEAGSEAGADPAPAAASAESPAPAATGDTPDDEAAPPPDERKSKGGKVTHRQYKVYRVTAPGKLEEVHWYEDKDRNLVTKGAAGSKRQTVVLARGTEDALKFGFAAVGAPPEGATLVAVAAIYVQPKKIKPMPPEPLRQRLQIS